MRTHDADDAGQVCLERGSRFFVSADNFPRLGLSRPAARFTKYLTTVLRLSHDNAEVTIDLRRSSKVRNILRSAQGLPWVQFTCKIVRSSVESMSTHVRRRLPGVPEHVRRRCSFGS